MLPRLVISLTKKTCETYVKTVASEEKIDKFHIFTIEPIDGTITIDQIRDLRPLFLTKTPGLRMIILYSFELATAEAQNALLKILEEKTENTLFILSAVSPENILTTIQSRAKIIRFQEEVKANDKETAKLLDSVGNKGNYVFLNEQNHILKTKEDVLVRLSDLVRHYELQLRKHPSAANVSILKRLLATRHEVQDLNTNPQFAYDNLLIFISKLVSME